MPSVRQDFIERMIKQLAQALARILGHRQLAQPEEAQRLLRQTCQELLGVEYATLTFADAPSTAALLGHPEKVKVLAALVREEALLLGGEGSEAGRAKLAHADDLLQQVAATAGALRR
jgi:hypothetical protein